MSPLCRQPVAPVRASRCRRARVLVDGRKFLCVVLAARCCLSQHVRLPAYYARKAGLYVGTVLPEVLTQRLVLQVYNGCFNATVTLI